MRDPHGLPAAGRWEGYVEGLEEDEGAGGVPDKPDAAHRAAPVGVVDRPAVAGAQVGRPVGFTSNCEGLGDSAAQEVAAREQATPAAQFEARHAPRDVQGRPRDITSPHAPTLNDANNAARRAAPTGRSDDRPAGARQGPSPSSAPSVPAYLRSPPRSDEPVYGALDLGTNNCRLLLARPSRRGFQVIDAFSRIIRLGEGVGQSQELSEAAMARTIEALKVCAAKIERHKVRRSMLVATEACRIAGNGASFLERARRATGLDIEILSREGEARLAVSGCASLIDESSDYALVFDIGGGSSELIWLDLTRRSRPPGGFPVHAGIQDMMAAWTSLSVGVVTLAEKFGGRNITGVTFEAMVDHVLELLAPFENEHRFGERIAGRRTHLLGTSGTVTTLAGIHLGLPRYDRNRVDGCWLETEAARGVTYDLVRRSYQERVAEPCIGRDRADLVLAGCAILEAVLRMWPCPRLRVADRGLREGMLMTLMVEDGVYRVGRRRRRRGGGGRRHHDG
ncbi:MAG: Ppx/GppA family phosphatase [Hyphomicrobiaceae bacterium]|nr:Ppx/GppA family phosphatase [Hyphomicrobiaceae bacterium]